MGDKMNIGDYGEISFIFRYKRKYAIKDEPPYIEDGIICMAKITDITPTEVKFIDLDGRPYEIQHSYIRYFKPKALKIPQLR